MNRRTIICEKCKSIFDMTQINNMVFVVKKQKYNAWQCKKCKHKQLELQECALKKPS